MALKGSVNKLRQLKTSFSNGELDPLMAMRGDVSAYANGAKKLRNVGLYTQGGVYRRPGTKRYATLTQNARLVAFDFDDNEQYIIAFSDQRIDIYYLEDDSYVGNLTGCPWTTSNIFELSISQAGDTMIVCHPTMVTQVILRTALTTFTRSAFAFDSDAENVYQPYYKFADQSITFAVNNTTGAGRTVTASANFFDSDHVNTYMKINDTTILITAVASATSATCTIYGEIERILITDALTSKQGTKVVTVNDPNHGLTNGATITLSQVNDISSLGLTHLNTSHTITVLDNDKYTITLTGGGDNAVQSLVGGGPLIKVTAVNQTHSSWKEQSFSAHRGYPGAVAFHDGRLWFGGSTSQPDWIWSSKVDRYFNFDSGEGLDDESIQSSIGMEKVAEVRHIISNRHLQVFTANAEFYCPQADTSVLTPENFNIRRQTTYGTNYVNTKAFDGGTIFVQKSGKSVRELLFTDTELAYSANSLSLLSTHLINTPIDLAVFGGSTERPEHYAMFVNTDGSLGVFHSVRSEKIAGWTLWESTHQAATCTITVTDYSNIATGAEIALTKNDGTIVKFTCQGAGTGTPDTDKFFHNESNNTTADNIFTCINLHDDFTVANPAANVITVTRDGVGNKNLTVSSTDTTRLATTDFVNGTSSFKSVEAVGTRCFFTVYRDGSYFIEELGDETNTLDHTSTFTSTSATVSFTGLSNYASKTVKVRSGTNYLGEYTVTSGGALTLDAGLETNSITVGYDYSVEIETMPVDAILTTGTLTGLPKRISRVVLGLDSSLTTTLEGDTLILKQVTDDFSLDPSTFTGLKEFYVLGYSKERTISVVQSDPLPMNITGMVMEYGY